MASNANSRNDQAEEVRPEDMYVLPDKRGGRMRACLSCKLLKAEYQWHDGCENCPEILGRYGEPDNWTTPAFTGMCALMEEKDSWVVKHQRIIRLTPGLYAITMKGTLQEYNEDDDLDRD